MLCVFFLLKKSSSHLKLSDYFCCLFSKVLVDRSSPTWNSFGELEYDLVSLFSRYTFLLSFGLKCQCSKGTQGKPAGTWTVQMSCECWEKALNRRVYALSILGRADLRIMASSHLAPCSTPIFLVGLDPSWVLQSLHLWYYIGYKLIRELIQLASLILKSSIKAGKNDSKLHYRERFIFRFPYIWREMKWAFNRVFPTWQPRSFHFCMR